MQLSQRVRDCIKLCNNSLSRPTPIVCLAFVQVFQLLLQIVQTSMARISFWCGANVGRVIDVVFNEPTDLIIFMPETNIEGAERVLVRDSILENVKYKNMAGARLRVKGRLTKRYRADRSVFKLN